MWMWIRISALPLIFIYLYMDKETERDKGRQTDREEVVLPFGNPEVEGNFREANLLGFVSPE